MKKFNKKFLSDYDSNHIILTYPIMHESRHDFREFERIYNELLFILTNNKIDITMVVSNKKDFDSQIQKEILDQIKIIQHNCNDIWIRDYCPKVKLVHENNIFIKYKYNGYGNKYAHQKDNLLKDVLAKDSNCIDIEGFFLEGGNIEISSSGTLLTNIQAIMKNNSCNKNEIMSKLNNLKKHLNLSEMYFIETEGIVGDDTNGHIDNLIRFINNDTVLYMSSIDKNYINYHLLKDVYKQLKKIQEKSLTIKNLIEIRHDENDILQDDDKIYPYSKLNFLMTKKNIVFPCIKTNQKIINKSISKLKLRNISFIECEATLKEYGGLHCLSANL